MACIHVCYQVKNLLERGEKAYQRQRFSEALCCYNDALDIDENSTDSLAGRAAVFIEMGSHIQAQHDTDRLLALDPQYTQVRIMANNLPHTFPLVSVFEMGARSHARDR